ncbi:imm11 family protein [Erwiniaceae bacterium CAU 1747]
MMNSESEFFVIEYSPNDEGIPHFMDKEWVPELPDYDLFTAPPSPDDFSDGYAVKVKSYKLDGDYFPNDNLISSDMLMLLSELNVKCISIPAMVGLYKNKAPSKNYYLFYILSYLSIIDESKSIFTISTDIETGELNTPEDKGLDKIYYEKIDKFKIRGDVQEHLFFCKEISKPVCSLLFKSEFEKLKLTGVTFERIDDNYKYDAWSGW